MTKQPLTFQTGAVGLIESSKSITGSYPKIVSVGHSLGSSSGFYQLQRLKLKNFLKLEVAAIDGEIYTVYDVIDYAAHAAGGIHSNPKSDRLKRLSQQSGIYLAGVPLIVQLLVGLGDAVDWSCKPIEMLVLNSLGNEARTAGDLNYAIKCYDEAVRLAEPHREDIPDFFEAAQANLEGAKLAHTQHAAASNTAG